MVTTQDRIAIFITNLHPPIVARSKTSRRDDEILKVWNVKIALFSENAIFSSIVTTKTKLIDLSDRYHFRGIYRQQYIRSISI